jgi:hypothetical protein
MQGLPYNTHTIVNIYCTDAFLKPENCEAVETLICILVSYLGKFSALVITSKTANKRKGTYMCQNVHTLGYLLCGDCPKSLRFLEILSASMWPLDQIPPQHTRLILKLKSPFTKFCTSLWRKNQALKVQRFKYLTKYKNNFGNYTQPVKL